MAADSVRMDRAARAEAGEPAPIEELAARLGIARSELVLYGGDKAKVKLGFLESPLAPAHRARLVLVSAITPTPAGEGKTATAIGLADALTHLGERACLALREPSLGPSLGLKGGGSGGGRSQLVPAEEIALHFTGDLHAVTAAHNLVAAMVDHHLHFALEPQIDPRRVLWPRVIDLDDRALRHVLTGLGGPSHGVPRESSFEITAASELMAILCLAEGMEDLRRRVARTIVGSTAQGEPVTIDDLGVTGAVLALLRDALSPNLVQTAEGTPAFVHGGPFANIAHGCSSVLGTRMALRSAEWGITEAGFGFDLGGEKFFDIKAASAGLVADVVVLVCTTRALARHGGAIGDAAAAPGAAAVQRGLDNLAAHVESARCFCDQVVVALNRFAGDAAEEIDVVRSYCEERALPFAVAEHYERGGAGAASLARAVIDAAPAIRPAARTLYQPTQGVLDKVRAVARSIYGARDVVLSRAAERQLAALERAGFSQLPVCIAKTQSSLSDDPARLGRPRDFELHVEGLLVNAGAGFVVVLTGQISRMPGLPKVPRALGVDVVDGRVVGL